MPDHSPDYVYWNRNFAHNYCSGSWWCGWCFPCRIRRGTPVVPSSGANHCVAKTAKRGCPAPRPAQLPLAMRQPRRLVRGAGPRRPSIDFLHWAKNTAQLNRKLWRLKLQVEISCSISSCQRLIEIRRCDFPKIELDSDRNFSAWTLQSLEFQVWSEDSKVGNLDWGFKIRLLLPEYLRRLQMTSPTTAKVTAQLLLAHGLQKRRYLWPCQISLPQARLFPQLHRSLLNHLAVLTKAIYAHARYTLLGRPGSLPSSKTDAPPCYDFGGFIGPVFFTAQNLKSPNVLCLAMNCHRNFMAVMREVSLHLKWKQVDFQRLSF